MPSVCDFTFTLPTSGDPGCGLFQLVAELRSRHTGRIEKLGWRAIRKLSDPVRKGICTGSSRPEQRNREDRLWLVKGLSARLVSISTLPVSYPPAPHILAARLKLLLHIADPPSGNHCVRLIITRCEPWAQGHELGLRVGVNVPHFEKEIAIPRTRK